MGLKDPKDVHEARGNFKDAIEALVPFFEAHQKERKEKHSKAKKDNPNLHEDKGILLADQMMTSLKSFKHMLS